MFSILLWHKRHVYFWINGTIIFLSFYDYCLANVRYCVVGEPIGLLPSGHQLPLWSQQREAVQHLQAVAQDLSYQNASRLNLINRGEISLSIIIHHNTEQDLRCLWFAQLPYKKSDGDEEYFYNYAKTAACGEDFFEVTNAFGSFYHLDGPCSVIVFLFHGFRTGFPLLNLQNVLVRRFLRSMMVLTTLSEGSKWTAIRCGVFGKPWKNWKCGGRQRKRRKWRWGKV